jgi:biotin synthase-related radical SAM superfamily protein
METAPTTAYLMLGGRCAMNCAFCAQARESEANALYLSRVTWPNYPLDSVTAGLRRAVAGGAIKRACIQVTVNKSSFSQTIQVLGTIKLAVPSLPVDVAILPRDLGQVDALFAAGADHIGFGLDAASERVFEQTKGGRWAAIFSLLEGAAQRHPGKVAAHLIVGLGETEREAVELIQRLHDIDVTVGLFAFTPVRGTSMSHQAPPALAAYRRVQAARELICCRGARIDGFSFDAEGRLTGLGLMAPDDLLADGAAFRTSGCPDCNRPYYNERPGGVMYNYPRPLTKDEARRAIAEMELPAMAADPGERG